MIITKRINVAEPQHSQLLYCEAQGKVIYGWWMVDGGIPFPELHNDPKLVLPI